MSLYSFNSVSISDKNIFKKQCGVFKLQPILKINRKSQSHKVQYSVNKKSKPGHSGALTQEPGKAPIIE